MNEKFAIRSCRREKILRTRNYRDLNCDSINEYN